jgi:hypothetical protein
MDNIIHEVVPYQWKALNDQIPDAEPSHAIENFKIASGASQGTFYGLTFQDSDVGKWIEAAAYALMDSPDPSLESIVDGAVALIAAAQEQDGYLNTYFSIAAPEKKWSDLAMGHEMYCGGHLIEGAVAYYEATGKRAFLDAMIRWAEHVDGVFGPDSGTRVGYCGHPEVELALFRLEEATGDRRWGRLAEHFLDVRGRHPGVLDSRTSVDWAVDPNDHWHQGDYYLDHAPVRNQVHADGHAVRAMYLYCAMADHLRRSGDESMEKALEALWRSATGRRMYVTGGIGSQAHCERFTIDWDLPSDTAYAETCAAIGLAMWSWRMLLVAPRRDYAEVFERTLYNGALSGISLDGTRFFYVNPLEVVPQIAKARHDHAHIKTGRVQWFGCACCPPNIARLICSVPRYLYTAGDDSIWIHQFASSSARVETAAGCISFELNSAYPWKGELDLRILEAPADGANIAFHIRIPAFAKTPQLHLGDTEIPCDGGKDGYCSVERVWRRGDGMHLSFEMQPRFLRADPRVRETNGCVAVQRGPLVYCAEERDNGKDLHLLRIDPDSPVRTLGAPDIGPDAVRLAASGFRIRTVEDAELYYERVIEKDPCEIVLTPYFAWGNRGSGEMRVWIPCVEG